MFVPYTPGGELARRLREAENDMEKQTGVKLKIVERTGVKIIDLLHKSDPWIGQDCGRQGCLLCRTKIATGKYLTQDCHKRCVIYQTWCLTCERRDKEKIEEGEDTDEVKKEKMKKVQLYTYIGETSRSFYERGLEHLRDKEEMKMDSHMLKHYFEKHHNEDLEDMVFGGKMIEN